MKTAVAAVLAAGVASACCIGPVAFVILGAGAFGASLAVLEPYRPILLGLTAVLLGGAFYLAYRPASDCDACSPASTAASHRSLRRRRTTFAPSRASTSSPARGGPIAT